MTRARAIELLKGIQFCCDFDDCTNAWDCDECVDAFNMAIEALEQEPTAEYSSDVISRQAAIDTVMGFMPSLTTPDGCGQFDREIFEAQEMFVDIGQALNKLPSAQPFTTEQIQTMQELESAQVEKAYELGKADRPTGHWIEDEKQNVLMRKFIEKGEVWRVCSVCGAGLMIGAEYETDKYYHETFHNYCPNCGADMRGGPTLTPEEFAEKMAGIAENGDEERKHVEADRIMCELLKSLGFGEGVGIFEDMDKWYS